MKQQIELDADLAERLEQQATKHGHTVERHIQGLVAEQTRRDGFGQMLYEMTLPPSEDSSSGEQQSPRNIRPS